MVAGHNQSVAWGFTNSYIDVQDLYQEHIWRDGEGHVMVEHNDRWFPAQVWREIIRVRGKKDENPEIIVTRHGPLINALLPELAGEQPLALKWTSREPDSMFEGLFKMDQANN